MRQILLSVLISFPAILGAQTMNLDDCLRLADDNNISLQAAKIDVDKAQIMEGTAWDIDKTELTLSQDPTSGASPDNALSLSQTIDFPTRYVARRHQLKAETNSMKRKVAVLNNQLHGQITSLYYRLIYERERLRILQWQDTILAQYEDIAAKRYDAGEVRQLEPLNASRLRHENRLALSKTKTEYANSQNELSKLLGVKSNIEPQESDLTPIAFSNSDGYNYSQTPEGLLADARQHIADETIKVERTGWLPSLSIALRTQMAIKSWNPYHVDRSWNDGNFMGFEIGVGIPIFNKATRARVKAARRSREQLSLQATDEALIRENQYQAATNDMLAAREQLEYYTKTGSAEAEKTANISTMAYSNGEISYIEYVSALQQSIDTRLKYAAAIDGYNQAVIKLKTLSGQI